MAGITVALLPHCPNLPALLLLSAAKGVCFVLLEPSKQLALLELGGESSSTAFLAWQQSLRAVSTIARNASFATLTRSHLALPFWVGGTIFLCDAMLIFYFAAASSQKEKEQEKERKRKGKQQ